MNMTYTEYRSQTIKTMRTKFDMDYIVRLPGFSTWRFDNIVANHWKLDVEVFQAILAVEKYLVEDLKVFPMKCEQCGTKMDVDGYIQAICVECREKNSKTLSKILRSK